MGSTFFPFRVDSRLEGARYIEMQIGSHKRYLPCNNDWKSTKYIKVLKVDFIRK